MIGYIQSRVDHQTEPATQLRMVGHHTEPAIHETTLPMRSALATAYAMITLIQSRVAITQNPPAVYLGSAITQNLPSIKQLYLCGLY